MPISQEDFQEVKAGETVFVDGRGVPREIRVAQVNALGLMLTITHPEEPDVDCRWSAESGGIICVANGQSVFELNDPDAFVLPSPTELATGMTEEQWQAFKYLMLLAREGMRQKIAGIYEEMRRKRELEQDG